EAARPRRRLSGREPRRASWTPAEPPGRASATAASPFGRLVRRVRRLRAVGRVRPMRLMRLVRRPSGRLPRVVPQSRWLIRRSRRQGGEPLAHPRRGGKVLKIASVAEVKAQFSAYLKQSEQGEPGRGSFAAQRPTGTSVL